MRGLGVLTKTPQAMLERVNQALDAGTLSMKAVFDKFNLREIVSLRTFRDYARWRQQNRKWRGTENRGAADLNPQSSTLNPPSTVDAILAGTLQAMQEVLDRKEVPAYALPKYVQGMIGLAELRFKDAAEQRAQERHEAWKREADRKLAELAEPAEQEGPPRLTPEMVNEIRSKVLGL
jgi:hypothetical protein